MSLAISSWPKASTSRRTGWGIRFADAQRKHRALLAGAVDVTAWLAATSLAALVRFEGALSRRAVVGMLVLGALAAAVTLLKGAFTGLHRGRYVVGSFEEVHALTRAFATGALVAVGFDLLFADRLIPLSSALVAGPMALVFALAPRYALRYSRDASQAPHPSSTQRVIIFGAGLTGSETVRALLRDPHSPLLPVALLDDDPMKRTRVLRGIPVLGGRDDIAHVARAVRADCLLVAVPNAQPELKQHLATVAMECGLTVRIVPSMSELVANAGAHNIREITEADLLGRPQVDIDLAAIAGYVRDRVVLVTGAGGSIGSEICRQLKRLGPSALVMVDRDESALHGVQLSIEGHALLSDSNLVVADIRDRDRMMSLFAATRPDVVFHAAALKHLPLLEMHPEEGIKTNIWGTHNVLQAAMACGTTQFVNISTDKAADPQSVLGCTKRVAERLTADAAMRTGARYVSVRFGNVLGSRGSVLPTFRSQIDAGGPVTVTDPDVTRYFMTTEEAVRLVLQAALIGSPGEVLVLDMGEPVRIDDVAKRLIARSGRPIRIVYTGLRPGEKLHERLVGATEVAERRDHALIFHTRVDPIDPMALYALDASCLAEYAVADATSVMTGADNPI